MVMMENREYGQVAGSTSAPYVNGLARRYALATASFAISHPSLPNYVALIGGSTFGITSDCTGCHVGARNLVDQLEVARISWKAYMEGMPSPCYRGSSAGRYAKKHDPFAYYDDVASSAARCSRIVPGTQLAGDIRSGALPRFVWLTPDLCHDGHDCSLAAADHYLAQALPPLLDALGPGGLLFLTWDEGTSGAGCCRRAHGGHVVTIVAGPGARAGARSSVPSDHYSILRTIEDRWGLARLGEAGCACTPSLGDLVL